ncbi:MAG: alanine racemase [Ilumatobacteraceae bacterium]|nr:alanine racemase [Ilumatobacteraceae bacterium]
MTDASPQATTATGDEGAAHAAHPKGFPLGSDDPVGWSIFDGDVPYPVALMFDTVLDHNSRAMKGFCERNGVSLAPHGKTTMAPALFRRQMRDGAWAMTAATTWQARTMRAAGVNRVLIANQVVVPGEIAWLASALDEGFEVYCYVDSLDGVRLLNDAVAESGAASRLPVLLEMGIDGGRTGVRTIADGLLVAEAAANAPHLALTGTSGFEGILGPKDGRSGPERVDEFLDQIVRLTQAVAAAGWFEPTPEVIVTAGGSAFFDQVVTHFSGVDIDAPTRIVIRSGCYISHDDGGLHQASPMGETPRTGHDERLLPAIEVWGVVLSRPEPTRALVGIGKRDASTDGLLPNLKKIRRRGSTEIETGSGARVVEIHDQHAFLDLDPADPLAVGDLVGFGISHPCTTFDKWRSIPIVDDDYRVVEVADTLF